MASTFEVFPPKPCRKFFYFPHVPHALPPLSFLDFITRIVFGEEQKP
jgi:hypothetical protein